MSLPNHPLLLFFERWLSVIISVLAMLVTLAATGWL